MWFLVFGVLGLFVVRQAMAESKVKQLTAKTGAIAFETQSPSYEKKLKAIRTLVRIGRPIPRALLDDTIEEAYDRGDWKILALLTPAKREQMEQEKTEEGEQEKPAAEEKPAPFDGVSGEEWREFLDKLKTEEPRYGTEKHVGAYHHNRARLAQLGIDEKQLSTEEAQRAAVEKDLAQYRETERALIDDYGGDVLNIQGQDYPITMSGVLGVLKAAGPKHARSWFKNPEEREQFPHTTETFVKTNGIF